MAVADPVVMDFSYPSTPPRDSNQLKTPHTVVVTEELLDSELTRIGSSEISSVDHVCVVGMSCRLPGGISSASQLWDFLAQQKSAQGIVPPERFNISGFYHPDGSRAGAMNVDGGYFLKEDVRLFENTFFGINTLEAIYMDPQQRKLLEVVFECFENAGVSMEDMAGSNTGVYVGNFTVDYQAMNTRDPDYFHRYAATGGGTAIMSNRISHVFDLHGPSMTLDTACSSSIYALHQACAAIRAGDCSGAIIAGANLIMSPEQHLGTMKGGVLSPTSTCHTFDIAADGYGRAEAVNAIYIKPLSAALRDKDRIRAVIRSTSVNANGRTNGISVPSAALQETVIRRAYATAGLDFSDTDYIECHGTGTAVGDPIEMDGLAACFAPRAGPPLLVGSVKTNFGHSEAATGLTSIMKAALAFEYGRIPPSHGVSNISPKLKLETRNFKVATELANWPRELKRASINSFGYGGANAHVILEAVDSFLSSQFPQRPEKSLALPSATAPQNSTDDDLFVLPISAASAKSLDTRISQIAGLIGTSHCQDSGALRRLAFTLGNRKGQMRHKKYLLATGSGPKLALLEQDRSAKTPPAHSARLPFAFVFTGQGAQYAGMAKELLTSNRVFLDRIHALDQTLQSLPSDLAPDWTLEQTLLDNSEKSKISDVERSQPICTAVQIALVDVLGTWGVRPSSVVGHSSGEIAAAYAAGLLSAEQALLAAYFRGFAVGKMKSVGVMMAAGIGADAGNSLIIEHDLVGKVRVGCVNAPESVTLSGETQGIETLRLALEAQGKFVRQLQTGGRAYHSHAMTEIGELYEALLGPRINPKITSESTSDSEEETVMMFSSVGLTPEGIRSIDQATDLVGYFRENLEKPVQFSAALASLASSGKFHLIEIGPHSALKGPIQQICKSLNLEEQSYPYNSVLVRKEDADTSLKRLAGSLFEHGHTLNWDEVNSIPKDDGAIMAVDLPSYPWDYSNGLLWNEPRASIEMRNRKYLRHELLGTKALAGNNIDFNWRNILRLAEMPWMHDHKLETQVVFPGAAYIAVAIEAISQVEGLKEDIMTASPRGKNVAFECRNVSISKALVVKEDSDAEPSTQKTELHTTLSSRKISNAKVSADWYDFAISSWQAGETIVHCTGSIRSLVNELNPGQGTVLVKDTSHYETWGMVKWYEKCAEEGLCFGPQFQSLTSLSTDSGQVRTEALATARLVPPGSENAGTYYPMHPVTIDACLQAAIMGGTAGKLSTLRAFVPVFVSEIRVQALPGRDPTIKASRAEEQVNPDFGEGTIHSKMTVTGVATRTVDSTLRRASDGAPVIDMKHIRLNLYQGRKEGPTVAASGEGSSTGIGNTDQNVYMQRHPCLRVLWKPDILRVGSESALPLRKYIETQVAKFPSDLMDNQATTIIGAVLDLAGHRDPRMRVLELVNESGADQQCACVGKQFLSLLGKGTAFPRVRSWHAGTIAGEQGVLSLTNAEDGKQSKDIWDIDAFDVVLLPRFDASERLWADYAERVTSLIAENGIVVTRKAEHAPEALSAAGFITIDLGREILLAVRGIAGKEINKKKILILMPTKLSKTVEKLATALQGHLRQYTGPELISKTTLDRLDVTSISQETICISLLEIELEFLATMSPEDMDRLRSITDVVTNLLWLTGARELSSNPNPDLTLSGGLSRALMLEQPSLRWAVVDVGAVNVDTPSALELISRNTVNALVTIGIREKDDKEFIQSDDGLLNISRFVADLELNSLFRRRLEADKEPMHKAPLESVGPARLAIGQVGVTDTMHFQQQVDPRHIAARPPPGFIDVEVKAISLNAKDIYTLSGRVETQTGTTANDFSGVIVALGDDLPQHCEGLKVGDNVVSWAPNFFATVVRVPASSTHKMLPGEDFSELPALLTVHATALYALRDRANLLKGESVLIHSGAGAFGIAAIAMAQRIGAVVYTTASKSQGKRDFLTGKLGVPAENIFDSHDEKSFVKGLKAATGGYGVDVIVNSLVGDKMHESWECLAPFGRFVEIGKQELYDAGKLNMHMFLKNTTFTAFDMSEFFFAQNQAHRDVWDNLMVEVLELYRAGTIDAGPIINFDVCEIAQAYRFFNKGDRIGKIVVTFDNPRSRIPVVPATYNTSFDPDKVYLLVGCLGGLGRSLSRWMTSRGARHFVFLGRSGADKPSAKQLVDRLRSVPGATVDVIRGDVSSAADVSAAVVACTATGYKIGGVVQAAMGLWEALFTTMPNKAWHTGIQPKWAGTWNLHHALEGVDEALDFFLLTSSISGSVGTATESNYCAANGFLDAFARWRRSQGKPAVSVGLGMISEVGYLHENPEIEALLLRKGIQPLNEEEFLQVLDFSMAESAQHSSSQKVLANTPAGAHILTGLEPFGVRKLIERGFDVNSGTMQDPRTRLLSASLLAEQDAKDAAVEASGSQVNLAAAAAWVKEIPPGAISMFASEADAPSLHAAILMIAKKRFSNLILMPLDQLEDSKPLPQFGVDSMLAAEFRTWFWGAFKVDVPFLDIVSPHKTLSTLAEFVETTLQERWTKTD